MKTLIKGVVGATLLTAASCFAQTYLNFNSESVTVEGAVRLSWNSAPNEVYRIDYADDVVDVNDGGTVWNTLYSEYPSHGTNTFWLDTGNYLQTPAILHPKNTPRRFYRIAYAGTDGTSSEPKVSVLSPTNNSVVSGDVTVTVTAQTDQVTLDTKLYVDGQEMDSSVDSTNYLDNGTNYLVETYVINTCEWPNGAHVLFATATCGSDYSGPNNAPPILVGHAVSSYLPLTFDNLITRLSFSEPFFNPDAGQTQAVTAVFTADCDWTLQIQDENTNTVRYVTGSGSSMEFDWDGSGTNGANLSAGIYTYLLSVQTNGGMMMLMDAFSHPGRVASVESAPTELWVVEDSGSAVPLAIYPPGVDTNDFTIFEASGEEALAYNKELFSGDSVGARTLASSAQSGSQSLYSPNGMSGGAAQSTTGPKRPPTKPVNKVAGMFGFAGQGYAPQMFSLIAPFNGIPGYPTGPRVYIEGSTGSANFPYLQSTYWDLFIETLARGAWQPSFNKRDGSLAANDLRKTALGGASIFNTNCSLGLLATHGAYGTSPDYDTASHANGAEQIYFPIDGRPGGSSYVRMSEMDFGSPGTNGLKWMILASCNSLRQANWNSIQNTGGWKPFNNNLHLLLGENSESDHDNLKMLAKFLLGLDNNAKRTIIDAWTDSGHYCGHRPVTYSVAGFDDCKTDMLTGTNSYTPQGSVFYQVLPTQQ